MLIKVNHEDSVVPAGPVRWAKRASIQSLTIEKTAYSMARRLMDLELTASKRGPCRPRTPKPCTAALPATAPALAATGAAALAPTAAALASAPIANMAEWDV